MSILGKLKKSAIDVDSTEKIAVKAEDVVREGGVDWGLHFFEFQPGFEYTVKLLPNIEAEKQDEHLKLHTMYKELPDPKRKGKTFRVVTSGVPATDKPLTLFFALNNLVKKGDVIAKKKIDIYLKKTNSACCVIQLLTSSNPKDADKLYRPFLTSFPGFSQNATIANLIDQKLNPTEEKRKLGVKRVDVFDLFDSPVLNVICKKEIIENQEMRTFSASSWVDGITLGAKVKFENEKGETVVYQLTKKDVDSAGDPLPGIATEAVKALIKQLENPDVSMYKWFEYKDINDPRNDENDIKYIKELNDKMDEILPIIENKSLSEIAAYGVIDNTPQANNSSKNVMANDVPAELAGSVIAAANANQASSNSDAQATQSNAVQESTANPKSSANPTGKSPEELTRLKALLGEQQ